MLRRGVKATEHLGRPRLVPPANWTEGLEQLQSEHLSKRQAAKVLGIGRSSVIRLLRGAA